MTSSEVVRAWKDPEYRSSLSLSEASLLPENPAGMIEISDNQLRYKAFTISLSCPTTFISSCVKPGQSCP